MKKILLVVFACLALSACGNKAAGEQEGLVLPAVNGKNWNYTQTISQRPVMIAFMAGFCGFCKRMAPLLDQLAADYEGKNVDVVLAFVDEDGDEVNEIAKSLNIRHAKVVYNAGSFAQAMGVTGFPQMYLIGTDGMEVNAWMGYSAEHPQKIAQEIEEIIK